MNFTLRPYQASGVEALRNAYRSGRRAPLYVLPTGGGKTAVFSDIAEKMMVQRKRAFILVHRHELLLQSSSSLHRIGIGHGLVSPQFTQAAQVPIQVASVQTLVRRLDKFEPPDLVIIDEAHHATAGTYRKIVTSYPQAKLLGVTATPVRSDGTGLGEIFDDLILGPTIGELIAMGYLVKPTVFAPPVGIDLSGVRRKGGDFDRHEAGERIDKAKITGDCVDHYLRLACGEPGIAFCVSVRHAEHVAESFRARGVRALRVDGAMDDRDRRNAIEDFGSGSLDLLTSADLISEGVDIPRASVAVLLRPTFSEALHLQQVGRVLRPFEGKTRALILDHVGNTMRHGLPDDDRQWSLAGSDRKGPKDACDVKITQCEQCFAVYEAGKPVCPQCGLKAPEKPRQIDAVDGELKEITKEQLQAAKRARAREQGTAQSLEELIELGRARGYNPQWAHKVFAARRR